MSGKISGLNQGALLMLIASLAFIGYAVVFLLRSFSGSGFELGVDTLNGVTRDNLNALNPAIVHYIGHVHVAPQGLSRPPASPSPRYLGTACAEGNGGPGSPLYFHRWSDWAVGISVSLQGSSGIIGLPTGPNLCCNCHVCRRRSIGTASYDAKSLLDTANKFRARAAISSQKTQARE